MLNKLLPLIILLSLISPAMAGIAIHQNSLVLEEGEEKSITMRFYPNFKEPEIVRVSVNGELFDICTISPSEFILKDNTQEVELKFSGNAGDYAGQLTAEHITQNLGGSGIKSNDEPVKIKVTIKPTPTPTPEPTGTPTGTPTTTPTITPAPTSSGSGSSGTGGVIQFTPEPTPTATITVTPKLTLTPNPQQTKVENMVYEEDAVIPTPETTDTPEEKSPFISPSIVIGIILLIGIIVGRYKNGKNK